jgi:hypothetical protein
MRLIRFPSSSAGTEITIFNVFRFPQSGTVRIPGDGRDGFAQEDPIPLQGRSHAGVQPERRGGGGRLVSQGKTL